MEVQILGAHNAETKEARLVTLLIDNILAIDAGALTSSLSLAEQRKIRTILITHHHFDHVRDLVTLGMNAAFWSSVSIYATNEAVEVITPCLLDGKIYTDFSRFPSRENPSLQFHIIKPFQEEMIEGYKVKPIPVKHSVPTVGYQIVSVQGRSLFYTADTGPGLLECWNHTSPELLITEVSGINKWAEVLQSGGHLCAELLKRELLQFHQLKGYLPNVVVVHLTPQVENEIRKEIGQIAAELGANISIGYEGMIINI